MAKLLISVRDAWEARLALNCGVGLIDVKDPSRGSLGRVADATLEAIVDTLAGKCPVSAALGELVDQTAPLSLCSVSGESLLGKLSFVKWGLAQAPSDWADRFAQLRALVEPLGTRVVLAAYADHRRARAPSPAEVMHRAILDRVNVVLLDTWDKDGTTLLDWMSASAVGDLVQGCHQAGIRIALAGSLGFKAIGILKPACPDWFAVRGSVCKDRHRQGEIDEDRLREMVAWVASPGTA